MSIRMGANASLAFRDVATILPFPIPQIIPLNQETTLYSFYVHFPNSNFKPLIKFKRWVIIACAPMQRNAGVQSDHLQTGGSTCWRGIIDYCGWQTLTEIHVILFYFILFFEVRDSCN
jgi:hypothetical protein